ncbi:hypothetical protein LCGC14_2512150 [marine sediment metagenome]|uniref:Uncharacterized protein n=1 Tax=marine sediment metagenome TaxID=412755 RepID=A0A0F9BLR3_9ZZZZ
MTDAEHQALNERIALRLGWYKEPAISITTEGPVWHWLPKQRKRQLFHFQYSPPDFTRKWEHAGPLFAKLISVYGGIIRASARVELQLDEILRLKKQAPENIDTLTIEAIAVAFDAWKEEKE